MANKFEEIAKRETTLSPLLTGRKTISMDEVIRTYPDGITITEFDFLRSINTKTGETETYPVICFAEAPDKCFFGGTVLTNICTAWVHEFDSIETCSAALKESGGVHVRFNKARTKSGNNITEVIVG